MANRSVALLTDRQAKATKKTVAVGGVKGLVLRVRNGQTGCFKSFVLRMTIDGKEQYQTIGPYPEVSLEDARRIAQEWRMKMLSGERARDDIIEDRREKMQLREEKKNYSVRTMLLEYIDYTKDRDWTTTELKGRRISKPREEIVLGYMKNHIPGDILSMNAKDVTPELLAKTFEEKWLTMVDTPERVLGFMARAYDYAMKIEKLDTMKNPALISGKLGLLLPANRLRMKKGHQPALPPERIPELFLELSRRTGITAKLAMYTILTASRASNSRLMVWPEVHLDKDENPDAPIHVIPREEMKEKEVIEFDRETPLSTQAVKVLKEVPRYQTVKDYDFVFAVMGRNGVGPVTAASVAVLFRKMNSERKMAGLEPFVDPSILREGEPVSISMHGTARATFKTWAMDGVRYGHKQFQEESIEHCLDHVSDKYNNAYMRRMVIGNMREIFEAWGEYCFSMIEK